ncbi:glycosyltransferase family 2 protein [Pedobacter metabolipauper]|uniref:Glycosyltransferase 2-like domain-containing protein n=1 Tax=Pedobacter metabolipauper TaxID=425513 RepID=A0A4V3D1A4_9SPHI|nr:glycosyltransferase family 2 protein [Pedobacter metabolipauper]TDQ09907.1 hypothetical protein ATK78_2066 [Pedobacter metabolipauper]
MSTSPAVTIIIVNYNTTALTYACIRSVQALTKISHELIVVDNASRDRTIEQVAVDFPGLIFIAQQENVGFGKANNSGIEIASGKYILLINSDTWLINDAIDQFYQFMEAPGNEKVGCCGADLFTPEGNPQVAYGNFPSLAEAIALLGFYKLFPRYFNEHLSSGVTNKDSKIKTVDYLCGADLFLRKSVLHEIGSFNPGFFLYFEETELSYRMKKAGYSSVLLPEAKIVHLEGGSDSNPDPFNYRKIAIYAASRKLYFKLCNGWFSAKLVQYIYALQAIIFFIAKGKKGYLRTAKIYIQS